MNYELTYEQMIEQERIRFENTLHRSMSGEFRQYPFKSTGATIHWLYVYHLQRYDSTTIHHDKVTFNDIYNKEKLVATIVYDDELKIPIFTFTEEYKYHQKEQDHFLKYLKKLYNRKESMLNEIRNSYELLLLSNDELKDLKKILHEKAQKTVYNKKDINPVNIII